MIRVQLFGDFQAHLLQCFLDGVDQRLVPSPLMAAMVEHQAVVFRGLLAGLEEILDGLSPLFFGDQVEFVEDQPAWFVDQRRVVLASSRRWPGVMTQLASGRSEQCRGGAGYGCAAGA